LGRYDTLLSDQFTVIKIDLPGFGESKAVAEIQTMELMAEEVKKVTISGFTTISSFGAFDGWLHCFGFCGKIP
jgi:pimeloyl-ACP methyl ester carboxylesterase